jgi:hypothetical protein
MSKQIDIKGLQPMHRTNNVTERGGLEMKKGLSLSKARFGGVSEGEEAAEKTEVQRE